MIASATERSPRRGRAARRAGPGLAALALVCAQLACATGRAPAPPGAPLEPLPTRAAQPPGEADLAARDLGAAVLLGAPRAADAALARIESSERSRRAEGLPPAGILPYAQDTRNAALGDALAYREASRRLLRRDDLDPALRARVEQVVQEDPLALAGSRLHDAHVGRLARVVNAVSEPIGRSLLTGALLPLRLSEGLLGLAVSEHLEDELTTPERQALGLWKDFIEKHPEAPAAALLLAKVEETQQRWYRTQRDRLLRQARRARRAGDDALAAALAERALHYAPEDPGAQRLRSEAAERVAARHAALARSAEAPRELEPGGRELALALLLPHADAAGEADRLLAREARGPLADEARFARASADFRSGAESRAWQELEKLAGRGDGRSNMARHARALRESPEQNPYAAFRRARRAVRSDRLRFLFLGPLAAGARDRDLPRPLEWALEIPSALVVVTGLPSRLLRLPWSHSQRRSPGVFARRYLERHPEGEHAAELRDWLEDFERGRGNFAGALRLAEARPDADPEQLAELREQAGAQALEAARGERRLDARLALLAQTAQQFEGSAAAAQAGAALREELEGATAQRIRISRGFLLENPELAGAQALALRPELLDGELENGELHGEGITLLGGGELELAFVKGHDESAEPERLRRPISAERLARLAALLQETTLRNALVDPDQELAPDADRDLFFERARLGVADRPTSLAARSSYSYLGMRERYGLVRSRESILPVELVLQGSFDDFGLGAFPRLRMPKETPDAFLYR